MIPERSLEVLRAIVHDYIETSQPVGSKSLVERHSFGVSSATIRNEMALLEDEQLIIAPHTSSGRVPTDKGYRLFVDRLGEVKPLSLPERTAIETFMQGSADLDEILGRTVRLLAQLTNQVAMVQYPSLEKGHVKSVELIKVAENQLILLLITDISRVQQHLIQFASAIDEDFVATLRAKLIGTLTGASLSQVVTKLRDFTSQFAPNRETNVQLVLDTLLEQVDANRQDKVILAGTANLAKNEDDFTETDRLKFQAVKFALDKTPFALRREIFHRVADTYDAMTSHRPYRPGMPHEKAVEIIRVRTGIQWDSEAVNAFLALSKEDLQRLAASDAISDLSFGEGPECASTGLGPT
ncbi:MAG: hypothetical protein RL101_649, partial [Actinomycetota bacterium]